jgi:hypothetical protein
LDFYVPEPGCSVDTYQKALGYLANQVKVIERMTTFQQNEFNFAYLLCKESNKVTQNFGLSKSQQYQMIFSHIPPGPTYNILGLSPDLVSLFKVVSTFATAAVTKQSLEKEINRWRLATTSEVEMNTSLMRLLDLINKNRDDYGDEPISFLYLFQKSVEIINRNETLSMMVQDELYKASMRIKDGDSFAEILQVLASVCRRMLKQPKQPMAKAISYSGHVDKLTAQVKALTFQDGNGKKQKDRRNDSKPQTQVVPYQAATQQKYAQVQDGARGKFEKKTTYEKKYKRFVFVEPWPLNKPYLSKSGNALTPEFNLWFQDFCHRCGCNNHKAESCRTYPERTTILTLCVKCRQGLHEECRSKRKDLILKKKRKEREQTDSSNPIVKTVEWYDNMDRMAAEMMQQKALFESINRPQKSANKQQVSKMAQISVMEDSD